MAAMDDRDEAAVIERLVSLRTRTSGTPGAALAVTTRHGVVHRVTSGFANVDARIPVESGTLFQFGSIGKAFTAVMVLQLEHEGCLKVSAPVTDYLPWFAANSPRPITLGDLLTHSAGLIGGSDASADVRSEVFQLRRLPPGLPPGTRFQYSNIGYKTLGLVLEEVTGQPYGQLVRSRILAPLDMHDAAGSITHALRPALAVGYVPLFDDRPYRRGEPLVPAPWIETDGGDGCLSAHADDLAAFARMLLNQGAGPHGPILCPAHFDALTAPRVTVDATTAYGYGLFRVEPPRDGRLLLHHSGGMLGYHAGLAADVGGQLAAVVLANGPLDAEALAQEVVGTLVAAHNGCSHVWAAAQGTETDTRMGDPGLVGTYRAMESDPPGDVEVRAGEGGLELWQAGEWLGPMERVERDTYLVGHPAWDRFPLGFRRVGAVAAELWHGGRWFATPAYAGPRQFAPAPGGGAVVGHYRAHNPWVSNFRVVARQGKLTLVWPDGAEWQLLPLGSPEDFTFRGHDSHGPLAEVVQFRTALEGHMLEAHLSDQAYHRFFTP